ncbi:indolepyruvate oxidoreductase subunit beta [Chlorobium phaeobacteroides]|jgi:indolepyruvate ferredoxin oxidoreductase beta subunit|uniref:Indolepyruvate ferredoxin oxidoreductase n=1 Tax=Chlorobium phaeobacteroides (strain DSM 266 / SMG 266 / 2430) TaxID=290317 RepID=A1BHV3_CHLPD|nr:indolepyruvate oxidoreductase subunit beta [Chlorobium phaeobacteroides]ABL65980.1 Indolepyruvate ferredoxin oxidoreductase [Chlorobium phaeobacteroides DSM 266]MBV5328296.1 indolepyruvate oxidoreductase subunit beta [Chlorobium sp.]
MQKNIIVAGVGGQGILSIAAVIDWSALKSGLSVRQAEVHGMSQRGGAVQSHLRISDSEIYSDLIPEGTADLILSVEPLEALRYLPFLSPQGKVVTAMEPFVNIPDYPAEHEILAALQQTFRPVLINALLLAREAGSARTSNMVMLGAAAPFTGISAELLEKGIEALFQAKGSDMVAMNINAFRKGEAISLSQHQATTS